MLKMQKVIFLALTLLFYFFFWICLISALDEPFDITLLYITYRPHFQYCHNISTAQFVHMFNYHNEAIDSNLSTDKICLIFPYFSSFFNCCERHPFFIYDKWGTQLLLLFLFWSTSMTWNSRISGIIRVRTLIP
jgi:hypothetical protein